MKSQRQTAQLYSWSWPSAGGLGLGLGYGVLLKPTADAASTGLAGPMVAGVELTAPLKLGDKIHIRGHTTDFELTVDSMQINNVDAEEAKAGDSVGIKVSERVRGGDTVYKVTD